MNYIAAFIWLIAIVGSQFYIFESGTLQPGHIMLILAGLVGVILSLLKSPGDNSLNLPVLFSFLLFLSYLYLVNAFAYIYYKDFAFIKNMTYWVFSFCIFLSAYITLDNQVIRNGVRFGAFLGLLTLLLLSLLDVGRFNFGTRFNAFFNDPNQMAYWAICVSVIYLLLGERKDWLLGAVVASVLLYIIMATQSRSALIGYVFFIASLVSTYLSNISKGIIVILLAAFVYYLLSVFDLHFFDSNLVFDRISELDVMYQLESRGFLRLMEYPDFLVFGAGQGADYRFNEVNEIHSSWLALLFYYGMIGLGFFLIFCYFLFRGISLWQFLLVMSPFAYGLTTYGLRTPIFWMVMASVAYVGSARYRRV